MHHIQGYRRILLLPFLLGKPSITAAMSAAASPSGKRISVTVFSDLA